MKRVIALALSVICAFSALLYSEMHVWADDSAEISHDNTDFVDLLW